MAKEQRIQTRIRQLLEAHGARVIKVHGDGYTEPGISDLIVCLRGVYLAIEVKAPGGKATERQLLFLEEVRRAGGYGAVIDNVEEIAEMLKAFPAVCRTCLKALCDHPSGPGKWF